jgi:hypothetical protein
MAQIGGIAICALLLFAIFNFFVQDAGIASLGKTSSGHAKFSGDCQACHTTFDTFTNEKCSVCHEKYGDTLEVYTFSTHYQYHSADSKRLTASKKHSQDETPCSECHKEHEGREAKITAVSDQYCLTCHRFQSFNKKHPQFLTGATPPLRA